MRLSDDQGHEYEWLIHGLGESTGSEVQSTPGSRKVFYGSRRLNYGARKASLSFDELVFSAASRSAFTLEPQGVQSYIVKSLPGDQLRLSFELPKLPRRLMTVHIEQVALLLTEPLQISWDLPSVSTR